MGAEHDVGDRGRVRGQGMHLGEPQVVGSTGVGVPVQQARCEVGDTAVQDGAAERHRPEAGRESLVGHGGGDTGLGGAEGGADLLDAEAEGVLANIRCPGPVPRVPVSGGVHVCEGGQRSGRGLRRVQDEEAAERAEGCEGTVEVHGEQ